MSRDMTMREQIANWCKHFNGAHNPTCRVGISYRDVQEPVRRFLPCLKNEGVTERCASASFPTAQEIEDQAAAHEKEAAAVLTELAQGKTCIHCHQPIDYHEQVGRAVYARPCRHRQYQGRLSKEMIAKREEWKAKNKTGMSHSWEN